MRFAQWQTSHWQIKNPNARKKPVRFGRTVNGQLD
jgi:hypothetical protein